LRHALGALYRIAFLGRVTFRQVGVTLSQEGEVTHVEKR
jgi:hypothetical protein